jgi:hypothetical protein
MEEGDGYNVRFWHDLWCGDRLLKLCYPILFSIARFKDAWVVDNLPVLYGVECCLYAPCTRLGGGDDPFLI